MALSFTFTNTLTPGLQALREKLKMGEQNGADDRCKVKVALQFLNWCSRGSSNESTVPPVKTGNLRGSASIFVGPQCVQNTRADYGIGTPALSGGESSTDKITIVYNTAYAAAMHEKEWNPGPVSSKGSSGPGGGVPGNKWIEKHLKADAQNIFKLYAEFMKGEIERGA